MSRTIPLPSRNRDASADLRAFWNHKRAEEARRREIYGDD